MAIDYVVISGTTRTDLKLSYLTSRKQEELYGFRYHSYYSTINQKGEPTESGWLYKVTDEKKLLLAAIEHGIDFYKKYETNSY